MPIRPEPGSRVATDPHTSSAVCIPPHKRVKSIALVGAGGLLGAPLRYQLGVWFPHTSGAFPAATFAINITGAFLLGILLEGLTRLGPDTDWRRYVRLGVGTGALGAFTTYSTLAVDTDLLLRGHHWSVAAGYATGTVVAGLVATATGIAVAARVRSRRSEPLA
ncbi:fluoride efflux transporter FluC [Nocardia donostiensis]|uniref:Fluoride-specific ion channel FluC n=1 Tax=Nocardia donostiensis TaxID=1538463 RepID=A0A1V2TLB4_9NOCA|nr:CrcB family protein [Nocardia donostiensis]ONM50320.1 chromosome condensation protein CrcB [Nocardia donostiensis]OQS19457.1 chromosome condensation protein CrcB [Nocardia donostiensis]